MRPAEVLLCELGVTDPDDIDIDAIAFHVGAEVDYRHLVGCEAQIVGYRDRAVIYVQKDSQPARRRFSTGHELGHWYHHRGQSFVCRPEDIGKPVDEASKNAERLADAYSADLILPPYLIGPRIEAMGAFPLAALADIAEKFSASVTATSIRAMRMTKEPVILVAHNLFDRRWQWPGVKAAGIAIRGDIDSRSSAFAVLAGGQRMTNVRKEPAGYWFDRRHIDQFEIQVQSMRTVEGEVLSLLRVSHELLGIYAR